MKKKIIGKYNDNRIVFWALISMLALSLIWLMNAVVDAPIMDEWKFLSEDVENIFEGKMSFTDFYGEGIHRAFITSILIYINVKFLSYNTLIYTYLGVFVIVLSCFVVYKSYKQSIDAKSNSKMQVLFIPVILSLFCFNQWEILTMQTSFTFMIRVFTYLLIFSILNKWLINKTKSKYVFEYVLLVCLSIVGISQAYWPAMCAVLIITIGFSYIMNMKENKLKDYRYFIIFAGAIILFVLIYIKVSMKGFVSDNSFQNVEKGSLLSLIFSPTLIKGVLLMLGATIRPTFDKYLFNDAINDYLLLGTIVFVLLLIALFIYFKNKMYKKTLFPIMLILYGLISVFVIYCGRIQRFGVDYLIASRYTCETIFVIVGILLIFAIQANNINFKKITIPSIICYASILIPTLCIVYSDSSELRVAQNRKDYRISILNTMLNIDDATDEDLAIFQANSPDTARNAVKNMKKYKLGVFKYIGEQEVGNTFKSAKSIKGIYKDNWVTPKASFKIQSGQKGELLITGIYPEEITNNEIIDVFVNGEKVQSYKVDNKDIEIKLNCEPNSILSIELNSSFSHVKSPDTRVLSFILKDVVGS